MAFPTLAATNTSNQNTTGTAHPVSLPASISAGDLLTVEVTNSASTINTPAGWNAISTLSASGLMLFWKVADGSEGATLNLTTVASARTAHISRRWTGHGSEVELAGDAGDFNAPSLSPTWGLADTAWVAVGGAEASDWTVSASPTNYGTALVSGNTSNTASSRTKVCSALRNLAAASEDPGDFTHTATIGPRAAIYAVRPAGGGGGGVFNPYFYHQHIARIS